VRGRASTAGTLEARLAAEGERLRATDPETFGALAPLRPEELDTAGPVPRGGGVVTWPVGVLLERPTELRWRAPAGTTRVRVSVHGEGVDWSADAEGARCGAPPLPPGRYTVRIRALDALAGQDVRGAFVVASEAEAERHRRVLHRIRAEAPSDLADLLVAHHAIRSGLYEEARRAALAGRARGEARAMADALLRHVEVRAPGLP
jgi:hypothetical protein